MKIMAPTYPRREEGFGTDFCREEGPLGALEDGATFGCIPGMNQSSTDPSFCTFWCAVALGALAKGSPVESVSGNRLASAALQTSGCR